MSIVKLVGNAAKVIALVSGILIVCAGLLHVAVKLAVPYCDDGNKEVVCVTPALAWSKESFFNFQDNNSGFRSVFTFVPKRLIDMWTPLLVGLLTVNFQLSDRVGLSFSRTWFHMAAWFIVAALHGSIGYAGNMGIIAGFASMVTAVLCLITYFTDMDAEPSLKLKLGFLSD
eukprot:247661_1